MSCILSCSLVNSIFIIFWFVGSLPFGRSFVCSCGRACLFVRAGARSFVCVGARARSFVRAGPCCCSLAGKSYFYHILVCWIVAVRALVHSFVRVLVRVLLCLLAHYVRSLLWLSRYLWKYPNKVFVVVISETFLIVVTSKTLFIVVIVWGNSVSQCFYR